MSLPARVVINMVDADSTNTEITATLKFYEKRIHQGTVRLDYSNPLTRGMTGYYYHNEKTGERAWDYSGRGNARYVNNKAWDKWKDLVVITYDRLLEKEEIEQVIKDPQCMLDFTPIKRCMHPIQKFCPSCGMKLSSDET